MECTDVRIHGVVPLPIAGGAIAYINADDFERHLFTEFRDGFLFEGRICDRGWKVNHRDHTSYAVCLVQKDSKVRELSLHRLVACARASDLIDHEDGNGLHNWRSNLRFTTNAGNNMNRMSARGSSSRFKGVSLHRQTGKFESCIRVESKKRHLGLFVSEEDAARAYDSAAIKFFGSMAALNFPATTQQRTVEEI